MNSKRYQVQKQILCLALCLFLTACSQAGSSTGQSSPKAFDPAQGIRPVQLTSMPPSEPQPESFQDMPQDSRPVSFLPVWKLMSRAEKQQFIAGYLWGWKDAAKVTEIAISYIKDNPREAVEGLERIRALYESSELKPGPLVEAIDRFYADPANCGAALSRAVSAVR